MDVLGGSRSGLDKCQPSVKMFSTVCTVNKCSPRSSSILLLLQVCSLCPVEGLVSRPERGVLLSQQSMGLLGHLGLLVGVSVERGTSSQSHTLHFLKLDI